MFRRFLKVLLTLLLLVFIAAVGLVIMIATVEDPLTFTIRGQQGTAAGAANSLECEVKNMSPFPMEFLPSSFALLPAEDARHAFLPPPGSASVKVSLAPGEAWQGRLLGPLPLNPKDIHTFSYDWNPWGQDRLRTVHRWLEQNASFLPDSWLASLYWHTEPRKGRVKHVAVPGAETAGADASGENANATKQAP